MAKLEVLQSEGFNVDELKRWRRKSFRKGFVKTAILLIILFLIGAFALQYLANLPRERHAKHASYIERIKLGAKRLYTAGLMVLSADHPDPKNTKLPIVELNIRGDRLDKLNASLPDSGRKSQKAKIKIGEKTYKAEAHYRGDSINHWAFPQKSWRIDLGKDNYYEGAQSLNLNVPRVETQISNWLGYTLGRKLNSGLVPDCDFVYLNLNRNFDGVRLLLEQPNLDFLLRRSLPLGKIYIGDITTEQIYGDVPRKSLYKDITAWELRAVSEHDMGNEEMQKLIDIIATEHDPYKFHQSLSTIVDMDSLLRYIALLEIVGSVHVDETHNGKFYFNPVSGKFVPIVWDTVAYMWKDKFPPDMAVNNLFRVILSNPGFREAKDKIIWDAINSDLSTENIKSLIDSQVDTIRPDIRAFALKIKANDKGIENISNERWEESIVELKSVVESRNLRFKNHMYSSSARYNLVSKENGKTRMLVKVDGAIGLVLDSLKFIPKSKESNEGTVERLGLPNIPGYDFNKKAKETLAFTAQENTGLVKIQLADHLFSKRRYRDKKVPEVVPANYIYEFDIDLNSDLSLDAHNAVTGAKVNVVYDPSLEIPSEVNVNSMWWELSNQAKSNPMILAGDITLSEDLILPRGQDLIIKAGANIKIAPDVSIIVKNAALIAEGTKEQPIEISSLNPELPWGTIAVNNGEAKFTNLKVKGGSESRRDFVPYLAPISLYYSNSSLKDIDLDNAHIRAKSGNFSVENLNYKGIHEQAVFVESADYKEENVVVERLPLVQIPKIVEQKAYGTAARAEREYKYSIMAGLTADDNLREYADHINKALTESLSKPEIWKAPDFTKTFYRVDMEAKPFLFRDIYFDTDDGLLYKEQISYRLRNRYNNIKSYNLHVKNQNLPQYWPYRLEFQAKTNRREQGEGFSISDEARFEFRKESLPFSDIKRPPLPPWDLEEFLPYFLTGYYKGIPTLPAQSVAKALKGKYGPADRSFEFKPKAIVLTERVRQHFNIKSEWGSGPNPEQAYIISLDKSTAYRGAEYMEFLEARKLGDKNYEKPIELGTLLEIEIEFERNVSAVLDQKIEDLAGKEDSEEYKKLYSAREAFLNDQRMIMQVIKDYFAKRGIQVVAANKSKFVQTVDLEKGS